MTRTSKFPSIAYEPPSKVKHMLIIARSSCPRCNLWRRTCHQDGDLPGSWCRVVSGLTSDGPHPQHAEISISSVACDPYESRRRQRKTCDDERCNGSDGCRMEEREADDELERLLTSTSVLGRLTSDAVISFISFIFSITNWPYSREFHLVANGRHGRHGCKRDGEGGVALSTLLDAQPRFLLPTFITMAFVLVFAARCNPELSSIQSKITSKNSLDLKLIKIGVLHLVRYEHDRDWKSTSTNRRRLLAILPILRDLG